MDRIRPAFGYAIVQRLAPGMTQSGIHMPDTAQQEIRAIVIESSEGYIADGHKLDSPYRPGDRVVMGPKAGAHRVESMPKDHYIVTLFEIIAYSREEAARN